MSNSKQLSFFDVSTNNLFDDLAPHIVAKFWKYHEDNPHVFKLFKRFTNEMRNSGRKRYGTKSIAERIRWHMAIETTGEDFKISNNYSSCYARLLIIDDPSLKGFFQLNKSKKKR